MINRPSSEGPEIRSMVDHNLKVFLAVANLNNFTRASEFLNLSQPAVTHQIKSLENTLKTRLFDRVQNRIYLTKSGEVLLKYAEQIDALYRAVQDEILRLQSQVAGDVHIGATAILGKYLLPRVIGNFKKTYPDVNLSMLVGNSKEVLEFLKNGVVELAIVSEPVFPPHLSLFPLYRDHLAVIVHNGHPWLDRSKVTVDDLFTESFISREAGSGTREVYMDALEALARGRKLKTAMVLGSTEAVKMGVIGEIGFSIVSRLACQAEMELGLLKEVQVERLDMKREFFVVSNPDRSLSVPALKLKEFLKSVRQLGTVSVEVPKQPPASQK